VWTDQLSQGALRGVSY